MVEKGTVDRQRGGLVYWRRDRKQRKFEFYCFFFLAVKKHVVRMLGVGNKAEYG